MLTKVNPDGSWSVCGMDWKDIPNELYGAMCKLKDYEATGLDPNGVERLVETMKKNKDINNYDKNLILKKIEAAKIIATPFSKELGTKVSGFACLLIDSGIENLANALGVELTTECSKFDTNMHFKYDGVEVYQFIRIGPQEDRNV